MFRLLAVLSAALGSVSGGATAAEIRSFDRVTVERLGAAVYRHDVAAAKATDALVKTVGDPAAAGVAGWIVVEESDDTRVRFLRKGAEGYQAAYDVTVPPRGAPKVAEPADRTLTATQSASFSARVAAAGAVGKVCRPGYNTVVLPDPDGSGWLVWLLAPSPQAGVIPVGGHYRVTIGADGRTVEQVDALSQSCLLIDPRRGLPAGASPAGAVMSHVVSAEPVETHVFLQRLYRMPFYVGAGGKLFKIADGRIEPAEAR